MCRASIIDEAGKDEVAPGADRGEEDSILPGAAVDPLATDLKHFYPSSGSFAALPRGGFTLVKKIAPGIHGDVFKYRWDSVGEHVSVKRLRTEALARRGDMEHDERRAHLKLGGGTSPCHEDALTEIGVLQYLSAQADLPTFVLRMRGIFQDRSHVWLVTDFADGGELFEEVSRQGPLPHGKAKRYTWEILQAIGYLHHHNIGHRDVSLENVLLKDGGVRLMDFGMAVQSRSVCGTPLRYFRAVGKDFYRAPECYVPRADFVDALVPADAAPGSVVTAKVNEAYLCEVLLPASAKPHCRARSKVYGYEAPPVDVFSAGVCLFILLTGSPPWNRATLADGCFSWAHAHDIVELMVSWGLPVVAPELADLLKGMTSAEPAKRWSAEACLSCLWLQELAHKDTPMHFSDAAMTSAVLAGA
mmetsp:Transcript_99137/g.286055  ORF Transcript_99137/g.286055 Transcript_99137/m.286055 type:complete len:417 (+) Transcript_99137:53-1303(+)